MIIEKTPLLGGSLRLHLVLEVILWDQELDSSTFQVSKIWLFEELAPRQYSICHHSRSRAGTNGYPIPDPNPKYFSIPDPYPINFQNHRVFRVSGIREKPGFWHEPMCASLNIGHSLSSIDFDIANIHHTVGMYFLILTGNRDDNEWHELSKIISSNTWYTSCSLGSVLGSISWYTPARTNIRHTSLRGRHW